MNGHATDAPYKGFWTINIGHLLVILPLVIGMVTYFSTDHQAIKTLSEAFVKLDSKVEGINQNGTQFSQRGVMRDTDLVKINADRISVLEKAIADGDKSHVIDSAQIAAIAADVGWIKEWVKRQPFAGVKP